MTPFIESAISGESERLRQGERERKALAVEPVDCGI